jgi:multicomponent K+:H+ antiporter subunit D
LETGAAILGISFLIKAGMWPLNFWLPGAYSSASAPAAAVFAIMSKVGIYVIARLSFLLFGQTAGDSAGFGHDALMMGGIATIVFGTIGVLASQALDQRIILADRIGGAWAGRGCQRSSRDRRSLWRR